MHPETKALLKSLAEEDTAYDKLKKTIVDFVGPGKNTEMVMVNDGTNSLFKRHKAFWLDDPTKAVIAGTKQTAEDKLRRYYPRKGV